ncbi:MAG: DNA-directed RNA polymerase subunit alpha C-terminal domain-containing protein [Mesorhizobium sp.]
MTIPLRAFLMLRHDAEWTVTVHRELEELLESWKSRPSPDASVGVLHVGFSRPPSRDFEEIVSEHAGHLLLTESAKYGLPSGFVSSSTSLGKVAGIPIYLALRGWGYELEDKIRPASTPVQQAQEWSPDGWVRRFLVKFADREEQLRQFGIFNEASYLDFEHKLPRTLRHDLGLFRFGQMLTGEAKDPCSVARAAPPWLSERTVESIDVTVRVANVFSVKNIKTIGDLASLSLDDLLHMQNFGRKSAWDLFSSLMSALDRGPEDSYGSPSGDVDSHKNEVRRWSTLLESLDASLATLSERQREIVIRRMGYGGTAETLQQLGERFGVTRERIRQVESKMVARIIKLETWDDELAHRVDQIIRERIMPIPLHGLEAADAWFSGIADHLETLAYLLEHVASTPIRVIEIDGVQYLGAMRQSEWEDAVSASRRLLDDGADHNWSHEHCRSVILPLLPDQCREFRELLWETATRDAQFTETVEGRILTSFGKSAENLVYATLSSSDRPLHYSELPELVAQSFSHNLDVRRAHNAAANVGLLFGRGTYGLDKHVVVDADTMLRIAEEAEQIIAEGPRGRQWHTSELVAELSERDIPDAERFDKYLLDIALKRIGGVERLGRLVWTLDIKDGQDDKFRIDIRQATIAALENAGGPLTTKELRERVMASRGVDKLFQIFSIDPVIRTAPGVWGLNDRDVPIKRADQRRLLDGVVHLLRTRGAGLHYSEMERSAALKASGLTVTAFFSLSTSDDRMRVSTGRYLYLTEWGSPRRESLHDVVAAIMGESSKPLTLTEILTAAEDKLGRPLERNQISSQLQSLEACYDTVQNTWTLDLISDPEDADESRLTN